jgi:hypothetical protein
MRNTLNRLSSQQITKSKLDPDLVVLDLTTVIEKIREDPNCQVVLKHISVKTLLEACVVEPIYHPSEDIDPDFDVLRKIYATRVMHDPNAMNSFDDTCASIVDELEGFISWGITYEKQPDAYRFLRWIDNSSALFQYMSNWEMKKPDVGVDNELYQDIPF